MVRDADVCVIGSGAAGAILAAKLAEAGKSVVVLEKGGYYDGESMNEREEDMIPLLWKNNAANFTSSLRIAIAQGSCLGGSTVINDAVCFRIPDVVVDQWNDMGVSIGREEWMEACEEVEKRIHVAEVTEEELNQNARKLREACERFRLDGKPIKHWKNHRNCGPSFTDKSLGSCVKCGFCHLGCHYDTKQSMLVTYIRKSLNEPKSDYTAYCNCQANRITYNDGTATGVDGSFVDAAGNENYRIRINAKVVVVSAGTIASSNLLQKSRIGGSNVGEGLALHPAPFAMGHFADPVYGNRGIPMSYTCHEFGVTNGVKKGGFLIESIFLPVFQMAIAIPSFGIDHARMMKEYNNYTMAGILARDDATGTIETVDGGNPKVNYDLSTRTVDELARGMGVLVRMWFDVGADYVLTSHRDVPEVRRRADIPRLRDAIRGNPEGLMLGSAHPQGGNKMGDDPEENVVNSDCKVFGFNNLYVCDASVFPTALGVNPQLTVMALATITANKISKSWGSLPAAQTSLGNTCHVSQPRFCRAETLGEMFAVLDHDANLFPKLGNSDESERIPGKNWKFDTERLLIHNDVYWKGFYGRDTNAITNLLRYLGGFYKRFWKADEKTFHGVTHPFETQILDAKSIASEKEVAGYGSVVHLEYQDLPYSLAYDLLKMVDENTIIGKAFVGTFPKGRELFNFSMSRTYDVDFMAEDDLLKIFDEKNRLSHTPTEKEMVGVWEGMLVSDSAVSPRSQVFRFDYDGGEIDMRYSFANMLRGRSEVTVTDRIFRMDDPTPFHDELRMVTPDFVVGRWVTERPSDDAMKRYMDDFRRILSVPFLSSDHSLFDKIGRLLSVRGIRLPKELGVSFLNVENDRIGLIYTLRRIS